MSLLKVVAAMITVSAAFIVPSQAQAKSVGPFKSLDGPWRGTGRLVLSSGNTERFSCRAYYKAKQAGLGFAIRCAAPSNKIELRGKLIESNGRLSGTWEERTFNATGNVTGTAKTGQVKLSIAGAVSGSMKISYTGRKQTVSISTATEGLKGISIKLSR